MGADNEPVDDQEFVFRLIHSVYYNRDLPLPVQPEAFRPLKDEPEGISVFRERFVTAAEALNAVPEPKRHLYHVVRLRVSDLRNLGLSVQPLPDPEGGVPGHAVMPELNSNDYERDKTTKASWKVKQKQLAELASANIVHWPPPPAS